ncbi:hypothetical protein L1987_22320 [Smallanthus sonchifolius]|uniref:Uncharacterized protein n=1 Tax=Smallanthus sonchifolius TaxID=185202 RepID=A0ACB9IEH8_9ASTR|nr:hypothetical protein L1987_22320 [Smallanthus sonchifolius]
MEYTSLPRFTFVSCKRSSRFTFVGLLQRRSGSIDHLSVEGGFVGGGGLWWWCTLLHRNIVKEQGYGSGWWWLHLTQFSPFLRTLLRPSLVGRRKRISIQ